MGVLIPFPGRMVVEPLVDKKRMAAMLGVNPKTLERKHKLAGFPVSFDVAGRARYRPSEVREWITKQGGSRDDAA